MTLEWQPLAPQAVRWHVLRSLLWVPVPFLAWGGVALFIRRADPDLVRRVAFGLGGLFLLLAVRTWVWTRTFRFRVTETTVETRTRVLISATRVVPLGRIQHVDVTSGPVERLLEVATVSAHTAAGDATVKLPGVAVPVAESVRDLLLHERRAEAV